MLKLFVCILAALCLTKVLAANINKASQTKEVTPKGEYVSIEGKEYYFSSYDDGAVNAREAARICKQDLGMELVSLETVEKWNPINTYMRNNGYAANSFWSSGEKYGLISWMWQSGSGAGTEFDYSDWAFYYYPSGSVSEPNYDGPETEVCVKFLSDGWSDDPCSITERYMCERN